MTTPKPESEINAEKSVKTRMDLVPPDLTECAGFSFAVGAGKHGLGPEGLGTYRVPGCEQSTVASHWASMRRHMAAMERGEWTDDAPGGTGLPHLCCFAAQASIVVSLLKRPPGKIRPSDRRWYRGREDDAGGSVEYAETDEEWSGASADSTESDPRDPAYVRVGDVRGTHGWADTHSTVLSVDREKNEAWVTLPTQRGTYLFELDTIARWPLVHRGPG